MTATLSNPAAPFVMSPLARAAGAQPRAEADLVHGAAINSPVKRLTLEEAARVAREAATRAWGVGMASAQAFAKMLMNLMRWLFRVIRANMPSGQGNGQGQAAPGASTAPATPDRNSVFAPLETSAPATSSVVGDRTSRALKMPVAPSGASELSKVTIEDVESVVARVAQAVPDLDAADPRDLTLATATALLDQHATQYLELCARAQAIAHEMNEHIAALANERKRDPAQVYDLVLADHEEGGDRGALIRQLHRQGGRCESEAASCRAQLELALVNARAQGLDVAALVEKTKVPEAIPEWPALLAEVQVVQVVQAVEPVFERQDAPPLVPPPPTAEERKSFAIDGPDDLDEPDHAGASPDQDAERLRAAVLTTNVKNEHQAERISA